MSEKNLPVGIQDFETIRTGNYIYVDKTQFIYEMVNTSQAFYFLSRPRRFGKSLLISTLKCLFEGRHELFKDLWIQKKAFWKFESNPVISFDFNGINHENSDALRNDLLAFIHLINQHYKIKSINGSLPMQFKNCITSIYDIFKKTVVILVDEYDKPIISHLGKGVIELSIARENREILKQFFGVLKEQSVSRALRFVFLTGVSKFSQFSIFSDLNNLNDISMQKQFSTLTGYTQIELESYFKYHIDVLTKELKIDRHECLKKLLVWYNGYSFTEDLEKVYNPFSILNVLKAKTFKNYWFETGTPSFLINLIKEKKYNSTQIEQLALRDSAFVSYDIDTLSIEPLLFQTGYITVKGKHGRLYQLSYPNQEVKNSFIDYLYEKLIPITDSVTKNKFTLLVDYLEQCKYDDFIDIINQILSSIPYTHIANQDESYYHTVFYLILSASGVEVLTEVLTSRGRIDIAVFFDKTIYIIELKCNQSADTAIKQIKERGYAEKYKKSGTTIKMIGINFDSKKREISDWKVE
ncbi:MAG: ATP-binding protein [Chitinispirillia bacterium]|jgi:hypothetical protein